MFVDLVSEVLAPSVDGFKTVFKPEFEVKSAQVLRVNKFSKPLLQDKVGDRFVLNTPNVSNVPVVSEVLGNVNEFLQKPKHKPSKPKSGKNKRGKNKDNYKLGFNTNRFFTKPYKGENLEVNSLGQKSLPQFVVDFLGFDVPQVLKFHNMQEWNDFKNQVVSKVTLAGAAFGLLLAFVLASPIGLIFGGVTGGVIYTVPFMIGSFSLGLPSLIMGIIPTSLISLVTSISVPTAFGSLIVGAALSGLPALLFGLLSFLTLIPNILFSSFTIGPSLSPTPVIGFFVFIALLYPPLIAWAWNKNANEAIPYPLKTGKRKSADKKNQTHKPGKTKPHKPSKPKRKNKPKSDDPSDLNKDGVFLKL